MLQMAEQMHCDVVAGRILEYLWSLLILTLVSFRRGKVLMPGDEKEPRDGVV